MNKPYEIMTSYEKTEAGIGEILGKHLNSTIKEFDYGIGFALIGEYENVATQRADIEFEFKAIEKEILKFLEIRQETEIQRQKLEELKRKENPWEYSTQVKAQAQAEAQTVLSQSTMEN